MKTTQNQIKRWFKNGVSEPENTHMIIVCDTWDYDDYPVYVTNKENVYTIKQEYDGKNMQKVMEVYNLKEDMETQLSLFRCFCYGSLEGSNHIIESLNAMVEFKKQLGQLQQLKDNQK